MIKKDQSLKLFGLTILVTILILFTINIGFNISEVRGELVPAHKTYKTITINRNDTLWSIASAYKNDDYYSMNSYIKEVKVINNLKNDKIIAGRKLTIPVVLDSVVTEN